MNAHLSTDDAARWVAGVLDDAQADALEAHARGCPPCEALLRAEARADERLTALVREVPGPGPQVAHRGRRALLVLGPLALAASLVLLISQGFSGPVGGGRDAGVEAPSAAPRYERGAVIPAEALTADEPFPL